MKNNSKGFVPIIILIIAILIVGGVYYLSTKQTQTSNPTPSPSPEQAKNENFYKIDTSKKLEIKGDFVYLGKDKFLKDVNKSNLKYIRFGPDGKTIHLSYKNNESSPYCFISNNPTDAGKNLSEKDFPISLDRYSHNNFSQYYDECTYTGFGGMYLSSTDKYFSYIQKDDKGSFLVVENLQNPASNVVMKLDSFSLSGLTGPYTGTGFSNGSQTYYYPDNLAVSDNNILVFGRYRLFLGFDLNQKKVLGTQELKENEYPNSGGGSLVVHAGTNSIFYVDAVGIEGGHVPLALIYFGDNDVRVADIYNLQGSKSFYYMNEPQLVFWNKDESVNVTIYKRIETFDKIITESYDELVVMTNEQIKKLNAKYEAKAMSLGIYSSVICEVSQGYGYGCHGVGDPQYYTYSPSQGLVKK